MGTEPRQLKELLEREVSLSKISKDVQQKPRKEQNTYSLTTLKEIDSRDLLDKKAISEADIELAETTLFSNFGDEANPGKCFLIWEAVRDEKWSQTRFRQALKKFIKTHNWKTFNVADFIKAGADETALHGKLWLEKELQINPEAMKQMDVYEFKEIQLYRYHDGKKIDGLKLVYWRGEPANQILSALQREKQRVISRFQELNYWISEYQEDINNPDKISPLTLQLCKKSSEEYLKLITSLSEKYKKELETLEADLSEIVQKMKMMVQ